MICKNHLEAVPFALFRYKLHIVENLSISFDFSVIIRIMGFVKSHRPPCVFRLCRRCAVKDGCLPSRESGMEACMQLSREIYFRGGDTYNFDILVCDWRHWLHLQHCVSRALSD